VIWWIAGAAIVALFVAAALLGRSFEEGRRRGHLEGYAEGMSAVMRDVERHAGLQVAAEVARLAIAEMDAKGQKGQPN